jgi:hypothetical protein
MFPNITIALRFLSLLASVSSGKCNSSVLKQVKNYYPSTMGQNRLNVQLIKAHSGTISLCCV